MLGYTNLEEELRLALANAVEVRPADSLLLSGGLDSSILAVLAKNSILFTTTLAGFGTDSEGAEHVANFLQRKWHHKIVETDEVLEEGIPEVVRILNSFDPGILNDLPVYFSMENIRRQGLKTVMTGDGADGLFAGYSYMWRIDDLNRYIRDRIIPTMDFSSGYISSALGLGLSQPYIDNRVVELALQIPGEMKVRSVIRGVSGDEYLNVMGTQDRFRDGGGELWGKIILREAFEGYLPDEVLWRPKSDLMIGSGMYNIQEEIGRRISDAELAGRRARYDINWWDPVVPVSENYLHGFRKLQTYLYETFLKVDGHLPEPMDNEKACDYCFAGLPVKSPHCKYCGGSIKVVQY